MFNGKAGFGSLLLWGIRFLIGIEDRANGALILCVRASTIACKCHLVDSLSAFMWFFDRAMRSR